jgi:hypothetical protein
VCILILSAACIGTDEGADHTGLSYVAAGESADTNNQFIQVLQGPTDIPWGTFEWIGGPALASFEVRVQQLTGDATATITIPNHAGWAIDPTILVLPSAQYLVFSAFQGSLQSLWIAYVSVVALYSC